MLLKEEQLELEVEMDEEKYSDLLPYSQNSTICKTIYIFIFFCLLLKSAVYNIYSVIYHVLKIFSFFKDILL